MAVIVSKLRFFIISALNFIAKICFQTDFRSAKLLFSIVLTFKIHNFIVQFSFYICKKSVILRKLLLVLSGFVFYGQLAVAQVVPIPTAVFLHPFSIATDTKYFFVSNLGNKNDIGAKDGDGYITRLTKTGGVMDSSYFKNVKLNSPTGLFVLNGTLFVADINRIVALNIKTKTLEFEIDLGLNIKGLGAITARDESILYVTAPLNNSIYEIDLEYMTAQKLPLENANCAPWSVHIDLFSNAIVSNLQSGGKKSTSDIAKIGIKTGEIEMLHRENGLIRSFWYNNGRLVYALEKGNDGYVIVNKSPGKDQEELFNGQKFKGVGEFFLENSKKLWITSIDENQVYIMKIQ